MSTLLSGFPDPAMLLSHDGLIAAGAPLLLLPRTSSTLAAVLARPRNFCCRTEPATRIRRTTGPYPRAPGSRQSPIAGPALTRAESTRCICKANPDALAPPARAWWSPEPEARLLERRRSNRSVHSAGVEMKNTFRSACRRSSPFQLTIARSSCSSAAGCHSTN